MAVLRISAELADELRGEPVPTPAAALEERERITVAAELVDELDDGARELLASWVEGVSLREIADARGVTHQAIAGRRDRILARLATRAAQLGLRVNTDVLQYAPKWWRGAVVKAPPTRGGSNTPPQGATRGALPGGSRIWDRRCPACWPNLGARRRACGRCGGAGRVRPRVLQPRPCKTCESRGLVQIARWSAGTLAGWSVICPRCGGLSPGGDIEKLRERQLRGEL